MQHVSKLKNNTMKVLLKIKVLRNEIVCNKLNIFYLKVFSMTNIIKPFLCFFFFSLGDSSLFQNFEKLLCENVKHSFYECL